MPGMPVVTATQFVQWIRTEFYDTYRRWITQINERLAPVMQLGLPSDRLQEFYGYYLAAPHPRIWNRGENISSKSFNSVTFNVTNRDWARRIEWHENDREDEQTKSLVDRAQDLGRGFAILHERVFYQILQGSTDNDLLPAVPNAPDGAAFFATTAAGANRFGATNGNLITGTGIATPGAVRADFYNAIEQFRLFQDGEGQPLWPESILDDGYMILYNAANEQVFREAFEQRITALAASTATSNAGITNIVLDSGLRIKLWSTQRITDNDWYVFLLGAPKKSVFQQERRALREITATMANSDQVRASKIEYVQWDARYGYGLALPYQAVKVNN